MPWLLTGCEDEVCLPPFLAVRNFCLCNCSLTSVQGTSLGSCWPGNSVGARKNGQEHLHFPEKKSCCQLLCCGSPPSMSTAWELTCSAAVQGGALGTCPACETSGLHIPKGALAAEILEFLTCLPTLSARDAQVRSSAVWSSFCNQRRKLGNPKGQFSLPQI